MSPDSKEERTIVVTGGADGIGRALVLLCAARGDKIAVLDKNGEAAKTTAAEAMKRGAKFALSLSCEVGSEEQVERAFEVVCSKIGAPYGLFTSAGIDIGGLCTNFLPRHGAKSFATAVFSRRRPLAYESIRLERR
jgi:NAD(P)-dependent dehydrogenase (short-subunit alcohol dehydrogenase family)